MLKWFRRRHATNPVMFRVRDGATGEYVDTVEVAGVFDLDRRVEGRKRTASGLCMIHWPTGATRLDVTFERDGASASVTVLSSRPDPHQVFEITLEAG